MLPTMPLVQFNTKCSYSTKRGLLGLLSRFESSEITPELVKALLSLRAPQQHQVMRRMTDAAVACLQMYTMDNSLSNNEATRLKELVGRYKTSKTRILAGARDMILKEQIRLEKMFPGDERHITDRDEWGDKFTNVSKYANAQAEILRRFLYQKPFNELIVILNTSKNKFLCLQTLHIISGYKQRIRRTRKILSAFLRAALENPHLEVRDKAIKAFLEAGYFFSDYENFLKRLVGLSSNKNIDPIISGGAAKILVGFGKEMLVFAEEYGGSILRAGTKRNRLFKRMPSILEKVAKNTELPKVRERARQISLRIKKCLQDRDRCGR
jgi:hypothetical protein